MIGESFRNPSLREIVEGLLPYSKKIDRLPKRVSKKVLGTLHEEGLIVTGSQNEVEFTEQLTRLKYRVIVVPRKYYTPREEANRLIKSFYQASVVRLDSTRTLDALIRDEKRHRRLHIPQSYRAHRKLTKELAERLKLWPYDVLKKGIELWPETSNPPIGYAWYGTDGSLRGVSWIRLVEGAEFWAAIKKDLMAVKKQSKFYGRNLRAIIESRRKGEGLKYHKLSWSNLPIFRYPNDPRQYSIWLDLMATCNCPDKDFISNLHDKRARNPYIFCAHEIGGYYCAIGWLREDRKDKRQFTINPFAVPLPEIVGLADKLRHQAYIVTPNRKRRPLNKTEMSKAIGSHIKQNRERYDEMFYHWGRRQPERYLIKGV